MMFIGHLDGINNYGFICVYIINLRALALNFLKMPINETHELIKIIKKMSNKVPDTYVNKEGQTVEVGTHRILRSKKDGSVDMVQFNEGNLTPESNPNGSINNIAGITNEEGNILGLMPHPERAVEDILGSKDGLKLFESVKAFISSEKVASKV